MRPQDEYHYPPPDPHPDWDSSLQQRPPIHCTTSGPSVVSDPETEKKLMAIEEQMKPQSLEIVKAPKEFAARDAVEAWEKKFAEERKDAQKLGAENARREIEAELKRAEEKATDEKVRADAKAAVAKAEADAKATIWKTEKEHKEEIKAAFKAAREEILANMAEQNRKTE